MATNVTITNVADMAQNALGDAAAGTWAQATVEEWVKNGIRDYGSHFKMITSTTLTCTANTRAYALPTDFIEAINVRYPYTAADPQPDDDIFLDRGNRADDDFWTTDGLYDVQAVRSVGDETAILYISTKPSAGEYIDVIYSALYYHRDDSSPQITYCRVPDEHIPIIIQYVLFMAAQERLNTELQDPDRTIHLIDDLTNAVQLQRKLYDSMVDRAKKASGDARQTPKWEMDAHDRIY
jgi:hypothetical protein